MGTDSLALFNRRHADDILAMESASLAALLDDRRRALRAHDDFFYSDLVDDVVKGKVLAAEAITHAISRGSSLEDLKVGVICELAMGRDKIYLDYWGCFAEVLADDPDEPRYAAQYFGRNDEHCCRLLTLRHVDKIIASLRAHHGELRVPTDIVEIGKWRDLCASDAGFAVLYVFDF